MIGIAPALVRCPDQAADIDGRGQLSDAQQDSLQHLLDLEAIKQLKARYFRAVDRKIWEVLSEVFTRDAVLELPERDVKVQGRDAIVTFVRKSLVGARSVHHGHTPEIDLLSSDTARGIWAMHDYVEWPVDDNGRRRGLKGYGHYEEDYLREDGEWRISRARLVRIRVDRLSIDRS